MNRRKQIVHSMTVNRLKAPSFRDHVIRVVYFLILFIPDNVDAVSEWNVTVISNSSNSSSSHYQTNLVTFNVTSSFLPYPSAIVSTDNLTVATNTLSSSDTGQLNATTAYTTEFTSFTLDSDPLLGFHVADKAIIRDVITNSVRGDDVISTGLSANAVAKKGHDSSDEDSSEEKSKHKSTNSFLYLLYAISNRTALCSLLNGTCVTPTDCPILKLSYLSQYEHGGHIKLGSSSFDCNLTTICCSPFLLTGLFDSHHAKHKDDSSSDEEHSSDDDDHKMEPYNLPSASVDTGYGHGSSQAYPAVIPLTSHGQSSYSRRSRRSRRRRRAVKRRTRRSRRRRSRHGFFGSIFSDVTNRTALCLLRNGVCVSPSECATNSAISPGASYGGLLHGGGFDSHSDDDSNEHGGYHNGHQIRSFLCNYTAICCLPLFDNYAGFSLGGLGLGGGLFGSSYGRQGPSGPSNLELKSGDEDTGSSRRRHRRQRRIQSVLPVSGVHLTSDEDRQNLCTQSNGTCVVPTACETAATYSDGHLNFHCNLTSVCCLPRPAFFDGIFGVGQQLYDD